MTKETQRSPESCNMQYPSVLGNWPHILVLKMFFVIFMLLLLQSLGERWAAVCRWTEERWHKLQEVLLVWQQLQSDQVRPLTSLEHVSRSAFLEEGSVFLHEEIKLSITVEMLLPAHARHSVIVTTLGSFESNLVCSLNSVSILSLMSVHQEIESTAPPPPAPSPSSECFQRVVGSKRRCLERSSDRQL